MSLATSNRDGGRTNEAGHLRGVMKGILGEVMTGLSVSQRAAGTNMSVDVAIGDAVIPRSDGTYGHPAWNDAVYNQVISAADGSNPRRDIVVMYVDYGEAPSTGVSNNTNGVIKITSVSGTAAGSPTDPSDATIQSAVGSGNPFIKLARVRVAAGATSIGNAVIDDLRTMSYARAGGGWNPVASTWDAWQYSAWDNTNKLATITVPDSSIFTLGQKVRYWQTTGGWKYGFIVKLDSGTSIIVYQGTDYTLNNERIYLPAYSRDKAPDGFPINPEKWTVSLIVTSQTDASTAANTVINPGAKQISIPIGAWDVRVKGAMSQVNTSASGQFTDGGISTANNSFSDEDLHTGTYNRVSSTSILYMPFALSKMIVLTTTTVYYLVLETATGAGTITIGFSGGATNGNTVVRAICAYL